MTMQQVEQGGQVEQYRPGSGYREQVEGVVLRETDLVLPFVSIVQPTSKEGTQGHFRRNDTGQEFDALSVVTLAMQPMRTKFPAGKFSRDSRPECWSDDDMVGSSRPRRDEGALVHAAFAGQSCAACEHMVRFGGQENRDAGKCLPSYLVAMFLPDSYETVAMRVQGVNTKIVRVMGAAPHVRKAVLRLSLEKQVGNDGIYYTTKVTAERLLNDAELVTVNAEYEVFRGRMADGIDEEPAAASEPAQQPVPNIIGKQAQRPAAPMPAQPARSPGAQPALEPVGTFKAGDDLPF